MCMALLLKLADKSLVRQFDRRCSHRGCPGGAGMMSLPSGDIPLQQPFPALQARGEFPYTQVISLSHCSTSPAIASMSSCLFR